MGLENYIYWNIKNVFGASLSWKLGALSSKYKNCFQSRILRKTFWGLSPEITVFYFWKYKNLVNIKARKFHLLKYKEFFLGGGLDFLWLLGLGLEIATGSCKKYNLCKQSFYAISFYSCITVRKNICTTTFLTYLILL